MTKHVPVLLAEALTHTHLGNGMVAVDATLGGGSYTRAMLQRVGPQGRVIALERDATAIARFRRDAPTDAARVTLINANFADIAALLRERRIVPDVIIADLGLSSDQLDEASRGLSFSADGPLDMRLDPHGTADGVRPTAAELVATLDERALADVLRRYGDEPYAVRIARAIVAARAEAPITRTQQLAQIVADAVPARLRPRGKHVATRTFQALRIAVNREMEELEQFLAGALDVLAPGGHLGVVTFHSGEDRIVKRFLRAAARGCTCPPDFPVCRCGRTARATIVTKKPVTPSAAECQANPRARSAKLRVLRKNKDKNNHHATTLPTT